MKKYKVGMIGLGTVGTGVFKTIQEFEDIEIVKIVVKNISYISSTWIYFSQIPPIYWINFSEILPRVTGGIFKKTYKDINSYLIKLF